VIGLGLFGQVEEVVRSYVYLRDTGGFPTVVLLACNKRAWASSAWASAGMGRFDSSFELFMGGVGGHGQI